MEQRIDTKMEKFNAAIRTTIGDLVMQNMQAGIHLEEANARIAVLEGRLAQLEPDTAGTPAKANGSQRPQATQ